MYLKEIFCSLLILVAVSMDAQFDSILTKINFELDYRFRAEQDWSSRKADGTMRTDRSRLRYRLRTGATYTDGYFSTGVRLRTGDPNKQQDPQLTLGKGLKEFGTLPIGFEKAYFQYNRNNYKLWMGKNTYPFEKNNELFWSDNVFPEGVAVTKQIQFKSDKISKTDITAGHFIIGSNDESFADDAYFQGLQATIYTFGDRVELFPSLYRFVNIPNIPDGEHSFLLDYTILHLGTRFYFLESRRLRLDLDYYYNTENYEVSGNVGNDFVDQKRGYTVGLKYGGLKTTNDYLFTLTYCNLERYSIVDYMAQNDWARWDYSAFNSPDGRLSNYQGVEAVVAYAIKQNINLVAKYYIVNQLIAEGAATENGQRIRFDINIKL